MARTLSERSKRSLTGVHPDLVRVIQRALQISPVDFTVIEGLRTQARQKELFAQGATKTMNSRHLTGHAVDLLPINPKTGKGEFAWPLYDLLAPAVKAAAAELGVAITWGGDWKTFKDGPHFELTHEAYPASAWKTDGKAPEERTSVVQTNGAKVSLAGAAAAAGATGTAVSQLDGDAQKLVIVLGFVTLAAFAWLFRSRLRRFVEGDR